MIIIGSAVVVVISRPVISIAMLGRSTSLWWRLVVAVAVIIMMRGWSVTTRVVWWGTVVSVTMRAWWWRRLVVTLPSTITTTTSTRWPLLWLFYLKKDNKYNAKVSLYVVTYLLKLALQHQSYQPL